MLFTHHFCTVFYSCFWFYKINMITHTIFNFHLYIHLSKKIYIIIMHKLKFEYTNMSFQKSKKLLKNLYILKIFEVSRSLKRSDNKKQEKFEKIYKFL